MTTYTKEFHQLLLGYRNEEEAVKMQKYMRDQFEYIGLRAPAMRNAFKAYVAENGLPKHEELHEVIQELWSYQERELQMAGLYLLDQMKKQFTEDDIVLLEMVIQKKSWWDTIDHIAKHHVGYYFQMYPHMKRPILEKWIESGNLWLMRSCIIFQLSYKNETDVKLLAEMIERTKYFKDFFIEKAIGWSLREYARFNPEFVIEFVETHSLPKLSVREAMKHLK